MSILRYFITSKAKRKLLRLFLEDTSSTYYTREIARLLEEPLNAVRRELGHLEKAGLLSSSLQGNQKYYRVVDGFPLLPEWRRIILETPDAVTRPSAGVEVPAPIIASGAVARQSIPEPDSDHVTTELTPHITEEPEPHLIASSAATWQSDEPESPPPSPMTSLVDRLSALLSPLPGISLALIHGQSAMQEDIPADGVDLLVVGDMEREPLEGLLSMVEDEAGVRLNLVRLTRSDFDYRNAKGDAFIRRIWSEKKLVVKGRH